VWATGHQIKYRGFPAPQSPAARTPPKKTVDKKILIGVTILQYAIGCANSLNIPP
jgi:hypothetical protein